MKATRRLLFEAFIELAPLRQPGAMTVVELCARAGIHRASFYRNYEDLSDLADRGMAELLDDFIARCEASARGGKGLTATYARVETAFRLIEERQSLFSALFAAERWGLENRAKRRIASFFMQERFSKLLMRDGGRIAEPSTQGRSTTRLAHSEIQAAIAAAAFLETAKAWLDGPRPRSAREAATFFAGYVLGGMGASLGSKHGELQAAIETSIPGMTPEGRA